MTLRDMLEAGIEIEGYRKVQCWETEDYPEVYHEGNNFLDLPEKYLDREVRYIFPYQVSDCVSGITIELYDAEGDRITKEMLRTGYEKGVVKFITDPNLGAGTVCSIGEYWLYFGGMAAEDKEPEEYLSGDMEKVFDEVLSALDDMLDENEDNGNAEYAYYYAVLAEAEGN